MNMMKNTDADAAVAEKAYRVTAEELRGFVERVERLELEKAQVGDQVKAVFAEAKARGYDTKALRHVIRLRAADKDKQAEFEAVVDLYRGTLGI